MTKDNYKLPDRKDQRYIEIENLNQNYQFTYKITYEMAIRNNNVSIILDLLFQIFIYYEQVINPYLEKISFSDQELQEELDKALNEHLKNIETFFVNIFNQYKKIEFLNSIESLNWNNINIKIKDIVNTLTNELYEQYYIIYQHDDNFIKNEYPNIYAPEIYSKNDKHLLKNIEKHFINTKLEENTNYNYNLNSGKYFDIYQAISKKNKDISFNTIYPIFSTALRDFSDIQIILNMNLPEKEIIDYIKKIKTDYDKKQSLIKTPLELLICDYSKENKDLPSTNLIKLADMFFIYDYYFISNTFEKEKKEIEIENEIQLILTKFHGVKVKKTENEKKNKKDTNYKLVPFETYSKNNPNLDYREMNDEKAYISHKTIRKMYNDLSQFIKGEDPQYKSLINK